jgi:hypothetical protein
MQLEIGVSCRKPEANSPNLSIEWSSMLYSQAGIRKCCSCLRRAVVRGIELRHVHYVPNSIIRTRFQVR